MCHSCDGSRGDKLPDSGKEYEEFDWPRTLFMDFVPGEKMESSVNRSQLFHFPLGHPFLIIAMKCLIKIGSAQSVMPRRFSDIVTYLYF
ncbi:hypothetical protein TNCT_432191 [Trichonephila clavata]|uniref:Uncharacterized protein n=1 Tax=Trichonephila clavata TaxID=2740835 RepID=A0A8X6KDP4_TRICU|nr:hypothetical protein TNCT_432191 [Trichonephila clavata]